MSGRSAKEIEDLLNQSSREVKETVKRTISAFEESVSEVQVRVKDGIDIANNCSESFNLIGETVTQLKNIVSHIATASDEQALGVKNITLAMENISVTSEQNNNASDEMMKSAADLFEQSEELYKLTEFLDGNIQGRKSG